MVDDVELLKVAASEEAELLLEDSAMVGFFSVAGLGVGRAIREMIRPGDLEYSTASCALKVGSSSFEPSADGGVGGVR